VSDFPSGPPSPPYWAVIFSSRLGSDRDGYQAMADRMVALASEQPGFLGIESVREGACGMTVSYWSDEASIHAWRDQAEHRLARKLGRERWYEAYELRVARVERAYGHGREEHPR